jgi:hypothetical protein
VPHFFNFCQFTMIETRIPYPWQFDSSPSFSLSKSFRLFLKPENEPDSKRIFLVKLHIVQKLLPNMLISRNCFQKRQRSKSPSITWTSTFPVADPASCNYSSSSRFNFPLLHKVNPS